MVDVNKIISYLSLSLILIVGIGIVSGILLDAELKMRIGVGVLVGLYSAVRLYLIMRKPKPKSLIGERFHADED